MAYFQGGDFIELLSAQGKAPAAAWKLQGKVSKTFDKGIKGNVFLLDGNADTKMQLPKTSSSSLGLTQRFIIVQLFVPFTRSFAVEMCFSDFQKGRRRFVIASAFRELTHTTLHVQLPMHASDVLRDQWMNLVFDLETLAAMHFPDTGYRSLVSICISGTCRLKRIFTMKDAPMPSIGSQSGNYAERREIPRQFVFSAINSGKCGSKPIPTLYYASDVGFVDFVTSTSSRATEATTERAKKGQTGHLASRLRQQKMKLSKDLNARRASSLRGNGLLSHDRDLVDRIENCLVEKEREVKMAKNAEPSPALGFQSYETKEEELISATSIGCSSEDGSNRPTCVQFSVVEPVLTKDCQPEIKSQNLRRSIMGEIQQTIATLEAEDKQADQRDRELFLRHTSIHSGEWHLQQLRDKNYNDEGLPSDDEDDAVQLSSSLQQETREPNSDKLDPSLNLTQRSSFKDEMIATGKIKESIFSFSPFMAPKVLPTPTKPLRSFDYDSLPQDVKPLVSNGEQVYSNFEPDLQLDSRGERERVDENDVDDMELSKLLAAKRLKRQLTPQLNLSREDIFQGSNGQIQSLLAKDEAQMEKVKDSIQHFKTSSSTQIIATRNEDVLHTQISVVAIQDNNNIENSQHVEQNDFGLDLEEDLNGLSIDLTSELSFSAEHDIRRNGTENIKGSISPAISHTNEQHTESDDAESDDENSSFDFEDLVDNVESIDSREEDDITNDQNIASPTSQDFSGSNVSESFTGDLKTYEKRKGPPVPPRRSKPIVSPIIESPQNFQDNQRKNVKPSNSTNLSSSFSSRRLQSLLESTDWTAELNAKVSRSFDPSSLASPNGIHRSNLGTIARRSTQKPLSRPQTHSTSSIELVYDPILRCYYDPVANKYYALAE